MIRRPGVRPAGRALGLVCEPGAAAGEWGGTGASEWGVRLIVKGTISRSVGAAGEWGGIGGQVQPAGERGRKGLRSEHGRSRMPRSATEGEHQGQSAEMKVTPLPLVYSLLATESAESSNRAGTAPAAERCSRAGGAKQSGFRGGCGQGGGRRAGWSWRLTPLFAQPSLAVPALRGEGVPCQRGPLLPRTPKDARAGGAAPSRVRGRRAVRRHPVHALVTDYRFANVLNCHDVLLLACARARASASCDYEVVRGGGSLAGGLLISGIWLLWILSPC